MNVNRERKNATWQGDANAIALRCLAPPMVVEPASDLAGCGSDGGTEGDAHAAL
jgi:hypothetical protein